MYLLTIIFIIVGIIAVVGCTLVVFRRIKAMEDTMNNYASLMYKTMRSTDENKEKTTDITDGVKHVNETVTSLTSSIRSLVKQQQVKQAKNNEKIYPGPQLLEMIDKCIVENISMVATLIQKQRIADDPLTKVTWITASTFPYVDREYLIDRCIYIMEEYNRSQTGQKSK